jgi:hypothetical protein
MDLKQLLAASGFALLAGLHGPARAQEPKAFDLDVVADFTRFRQEFGARDDYASRCEADRPLERMVAAVNSQDPERMRAVVLPWLRQCPVDIQAHMFALVSYMTPEPRSRAEIPAQADVHHDWYTGLVESVLASGDGKSAETAYVTISVDEEKAVLAHLQLRQISQTLVRTPLRDRIEAEDAQGRRHTIWFHPAAHFARLAKKVKEVVSERTP